MTSKLVRLLEEKQRSMRLSPAEGIEAHRELQVKLGERALSGKAPDAYEELVRLSTAAVIHPPACAQLGFCEPNHKQQLVVLVDDYWAAREFELRIHSKTIDLVVRSCGMFDVWTPFFSKYGRWILGGAPPLEFMPWDRIEQQLRDVLKKCSLTLPALDENSLPRAEKYLEYCKPIHQAATFLHFIMRREAPPLHDPTQLSAVDFNKVIEFEHLLPWLRKYLEGHAE